MVQDVSLPVFQTVMWSLLQITYIILILRLYITTHRWTSAPTISDSFIIAAGILNTVAVVISCLMNLSLSGLVKLSMNEIVISSVNTFNYYVILAIIRASVLALYHPMFKALSSPWARYYYWGTCVYNGTTLLVMIVLETFTCWHEPRTWQFDNSHCAPYRLQVLAITITTLIVSSDFAVLCLPLFLLQKLRRRQKNLIWGVILVVTMGSVSMGTSLARFLLLWVQSNRLTGLHPQGLLTNGLLIDFEIFSAFVAANLPAFRAGIKNTRSISLKGKSIRGKEKSLDSSIA